MSHFQMVPVLMLLMAALVAADEPMMELSDAVESVDSASVSVVHCDAATVCPDGTTCCLSPYGVWYCCPFSMVNHSKMGNCFILH